MHTSLAVELKARTSLRQEHFQRSSGPESSYVALFLLVLSTLNGASLRDHDMIKGTLVCKMFLWREVQISLKYKELSN